MVAASLAILEEAAVACRDLCATLQSSAPTLLAYTAAAFWLSIKLLGVRTTSPNPKLLSQATQLQISRITDAEMTLLKALGWDLARVLRHRGIHLA